MVIEYLRAAKSAQFYRLRKSLTKTAVADLFAHVAGEETRRFKARTVRETVPGQPAVYSFACFKTLSKPPFLDNTDLRDEQYVFLLLVEVGKTLAVLKRNVDVPQALLRDFVEPFGYEKLGGVYGDRNAAWEQISLRGMSLMANTVRRRTLEADNLGRAMSTFGIQRSIPGAFRTRSWAGIHTITPGTSRIARRSERADLNGLVQWIAETGDALHRAQKRQYEESFLAQFCHPVPLAEIEGCTEPNGLLFELAEMESAIIDRPSEFYIVLRWWKRRKRRERRLSEAGALRLLQRLKNVLRVSDGKILYDFSTGKTLPLGTLKVNRRSIRVSSPALDRIVVRLPAGEKPFTRWMNQQDSFLVTFENPRYAYTDGQLFEDQRLLSTTGALLEIMDPEPELDRVTDEKDAQPGGFGPVGVFHVVEDRLALRGAVLVTDDLSDEWADYIEFAPRAVPPRLSFFHCKHGDPTTSAAKFQDVIGQALKNLSRLHADAGEFEEKWHRVWSHEYTRPKPFPRLRKGDRRTAAQKICATVAAPRLERTVCLVVSFLSKAATEKAFDDLKQGNAAAHVTQLLWFLSGYVGACREHGVIPRIVCRP